MKQITFEPHKNNWLAYNDLIIVTIFNWNGRYHCYTNNKFGQYAPIFFKGLSEAMAWAIRELN